LLARGASAAARARRRERGGARRRGRLGSAPMEFLLLCIVSVLFVFTAGAYFAGRGGD
jgi:hypothetical protein